MKTRVAYWSCQIIGWGAYSALGITIGAQQIGWKFSLVAGYLLFFIYSVALTDLLRREMRRRQWLDVLGFRTFLRLFGVAVAMAAVQTILVFVINLMFEGRQSLLFRSPEFAIPTWLSVSFANCMWLLSYVALTSGRRYRE